MTNKSVTQASAGAMPTLHDYITGEELRPATAEEHRASIRAAEIDGGRGVIVLDDGTRCYVTDPCPDTLPATGRTEDAWWAWHDADPSRHSPGGTPTEGTEDAERRCAAWVRGESADGPEDDAGDLERLRDVTDARIYSYEIVSGVEVYGLTDDGAKLARSLGYRVDVDSYGQAFAVGLVVRRTAKEVTP